MKGKIIYLDSVRGGSVPPRPPSPLQPCPEEEFEISPSVLAAEQVMRDLLHCVIPREELIAAYKVFCQLFEADLGETEPTAA